MFFSPKKKIKVLVVDDSVVQRKLTRSRLSGKTENGADIDQVMVNTAENGERALAYCNETTVLPDVVLIDYHIKDKNGLELLSMIRNAAIESKCFMLTMRRDVLIRNKAKEVGGNGYLLKSIGAEEVAAVASACLTIRSSSEW
jgi:DNA-binding NarL/FixJ family response regulator